MSTQDQQNWNHKIGHIHLEALIYLETQDQAYYHIPSSSYTFYKIVNIQKALIYLYFIHLEKY